MNANPDQDFVLKTIKNRDVHFVRCWFVDVLGRLKSFAIIPGELEEAFEWGFGFDSYFIEGFNSGKDTDMRAFPDASTFQILPWRPESDAVARMFCSIRTFDGEPVNSDPRNILKRVVDQAAKKGYSFNVCSEPEFYYFKDSSGTEVLDHGRYFDLTSLDYASDLRRDTVLNLEMLGIPVIYSHHEQGPSQHEIALRYSDALSMADAVMTYKLVVKEIAIKNGVYASFMPKPLQEVPGSSMHIQQSLTDLDDVNLFFDLDAKDESYLSQTAKHYIAGILKYAPEFTVLTNQYVNSYKRLVGDKGAPSVVAWSHSNRSTIVRVPRFRPEKQEACRIELRNPDPAANPYLVFAILLAAGLKGIEDKLELPPSAESKDFSKLSRCQIIEEGFSVLPASLGEAVELFSASDLMRETLGEEVHSYIVEEKRNEWNSYLQHVSSWELDRYLEVL